MFLQFYCKTDQKAINGNNDSPNKEGCGDKVILNKRYGLIGIDNAYFQGVYLPFIILMINNQYIIKSMKLE